MTAGKQQTTKSSQGFKVAKDSDITPQQLIIVQWVQG